MLIKRLAAISVAVAILGYIGLVVYGVVNKPTQTLVPATTISGTTKNPSPSESTTPLPGSRSSIYCMGRNPCYGQTEVAKHTKKGDCWGWNKDIVIDITAFSKGYHLAKSGIDIEVSSVCGKNLAPALSGHVDIDGLTRNHKPDTKNNQERNVVPYFIGYVDSSKP